MKFINKYLIIIFSLLLIFTTNSCSKICSGEEPRAQIKNNGIDLASVQVKTSGGNTININNVHQGTTSAFSSYAAGNVVFTITLKTINYVTALEMKSCNDYYINIDANNIITTTSIDRSI